MRKFYNSDETQSFLYSLTNTATYFFLIINNSEQINIPTWAIVLILTQSPSVAAALFGSNIEMLEEKRLRALALQQQPANGIIAAPGPNLAGVAPPLQIQNAPNPNLHAPLLGPAPGQNAGCSRRLRRFANWPGHAILGADLKQLGGSSSIALLLYQPLHQSSKTAALAVSISAAILLAPSSFRVQLAALRSNRTPSKALKAINRFFSCCNDSWHIRPFNLSNCATYAMSLANFVMLLIKLGGLSDLNTEQKTFLYVASSVIVTPMFFTGNVAYRNRIQKFIQVNDPERFEALEPQRNETPSCEVRHCNDSKRIGKASSVWSSITKSFAGLASLFSLFYLGLQLASASESLSLSIAGILCLFFILPNFNATFALFTYQAPTTPGAIEHAVEEEEEEEEERALPAQQQPEDGARAAAPPPPGNPALPKAGSRLLPQRDIILVIGAGRDGPYVPPRKRPPSPDAEALGMERDHSHKMLPVGSFRTFKSVSFGYQNEGVMPVGRVHTEKTPALDKSAPTEASRLLTIKIGNPE